MDSQSVSLFPSYKETTEPHLGPVIWTSLRS